MNAKFTVRAIQQGQAQKTHTVTAGAGQNGQALVLQAAANTRYQLADMLTFTSPAKLQLKRAGKDLLVALPGNDVSSPDIVIRDYFEFDGMSLSGLTQSGEPMVYDTGSGLFSSIMPGAKSGVTAQSLAPNQTTSASLAKGSAGWFDTGWGLVTLGAGGLALAAAGGSGGSSNNASLSKITTYKADQTKAVPSVTDFGIAGVGGVDAGNITGILTYFPRTQLPLDSAASLQTLVDSYKKILTEANGTSADATPTSDPLLSDYVNLMGSSIPASLNTKAGALALLNDRIKALNSTDVDTYTELKAFADAVEAVSQLAQSAPSTTGTAATTGNITAAQLTSLGVDVTATSLSAVSDAIRASADDLSTLNTTEKLSALVKAYNTILAEANGTAADATTANPTAADYAAIGANIGSAKTDADALARLNAIVGNLSSTSVDTVDEINKLATTLDKIQTVAALATGATLTDAQKFSVDELKNLGLTGFGGNDVQNTTLALKVSEAIRDKNPEDVIAGVFAKGKLDTSVAPNTPIDWSQTQLERLQTLVSQEIIKNYVVDTTTPANTTIAPTLTDWQNIGVFKPIALKNDTSTSAAEGYTALSATELAYLNSAADKLTATAIDTPAKAQAVLEACMRIVQEANGSDTDKDATLNPTAVDLQTVGVTGDVTGTAKKASALMLDVIANLISASVDTISELQALANTTTRLMAEAAKASGDTTGAFTTTELNNLGLRGASASGASGNLGDFLKHIRETTNDGSQIDTLAELQSWMSLSIVQAWARDVDITTSPAVNKTAATPAAQDYKDIGVVRSVPKNADGTSGTVPTLMSLADVSALNDAVDTLVDNSSATTADDAKIDSLAKVQAIATSYFSILNEANGSASNYINGHTVQTVDAVNSIAYVDDAAVTSNVGSTGTNPLNYDLSPNPTATDYTNIGITGTFDDHRISLLNTLIAEKTFGQVDTVKEIQTLADTANKVLALAAKFGATVADADKLSLTQLQTDLALTGVTSTNLDHVLQAIQNTADDQSAADSFAELQGLVSLTRILDYADSAANAMPSSFDWSALIGLHGELASNISAYNSAVDASSSNVIGGLGGLQSLVDSYNKILAEADGNASSSPSTYPTLPDYVQILGSNPNSFLFTGLNDGTNQSDATQLLINANGVLTSDKVDTVSELKAIADAAGRVIALANESDGATNASGQATVTNAAGLTKNHLTLLGLDTSKINNGYGTNDTYEASNIFAEISKLTPSAAHDLQTLQNVVNTWARI